MKLHYDNKTDYAEIILKSEDSYEDETIEGFSIFRSEDTDEIVGIGIHNLKQLMEENNGN